MKNMKPIKTTRSTKIAGNAIAISNISCLRFIFINAVCGIEPPCLALTRYAPLHLNSTNLSFTKPLYPNLRGIA